MVAESSAAPGRPAATRQWEGLSQPPGWHDSRSAGYTAAPSVTRRLRAPRVSTPPRICGDGVEYVDDRHVERVGPPNKDSERRGAPAPFHIPNKTPRQPRGFGDILKAEARLLPQFPEPMAQLSLRVVHLLSGHPAEAS